MKKKINILRLYLFHVSHRALAVWSLLRKNKKNSIFTGFVSAAAPGGNIWPQLQTLVNYGRLKCSCLSKRQKRTTIVCWTLSGLKANINWLSGRTFRNAARKMLRLHVAKKKKVVFCCSACFTVLLAADEVSRSLTISTWRVRVFILQWWGPALCGFFSLSVCLSVAATHVVKNGNAKEYWSFSFLF